MSPVNKIKNALMVNSLPTVYEDTLSYYEQLSNLINYVNQLIDMINQYFSVDVKTNIEIILNQWVEDGRLAELVSKTLLLQKLDKTVFDAYVIELNNRLDLLDTSLETFKTNIENEIIAFKNSINEEIEAIKLSRKDVSGKILRNKLKSGFQNCVIAVLGDSTGNGLDEWFEKFRVWYSETITNYNIDRRLWNHTNQQYDPVIREKNYLGSVRTDEVNSTSGMSVVTPHRPQQTITGDIDIRVQFKFDASMTGSYTEIFSKMGTSGNRGYMLGFFGNGNPYISYSINGVDLITVGAPASIYPYLNEMAWLRVTIDVDNGSGGNDIKFYTSLDGVTWSQLGTTVTTSGVIALYPTSADINLLSRGTNLFKGSFKKAELRSAINGSIVYSVEILNNLSSFTDNYGNEINLQGNYTFNEISNNLLFLNGSHSGGNINYSIDDTRLSKQLYKKPDIVFINYAHNENVNRDYYAQVESLIAKIKIINPYVEIILIGQNPQVSPASQYYIDSHAIRTSQVGEVALKNNLLFIDVFSAFMSVENYATVLMVDDAHPNALGQEIWFDLVKSYFIRG